MPTLCQSVRHLTTQQRERRGFVKQHCVSSCSGEAQRCQPEPRATDLVLELMLLVSQPLQLLFSTTKLRRNTHNMLSTQRVKR